MPTIIRPTTRMIQYGGGPQMRYAQAASVTAPVKDNLIGWWALDETSGTRADSHAGNNLSEVNTVGYTTGVVNNAAHIVRLQAEHLWAADSPALSVADEDFTIAFWVNLTSVVASTHILVAKRDYGSSSSEWWLQYSSGKFNFYVSNNGSTVTGIASNETISTGQWYYVVAWHDAVADTINIQTNGGVPATTAHSGGCYNGVAKFSVGAIFFNGSPYNPYLPNGYFDELSFWRQTLSGPERSWLYNSGAGRAYTDL